MLSIVTYFWSLAIIVYFFSKVFSMVLGSVKEKMGVYLSTPKTEKFSENGENERLKYGLSSMQGWRTTMEDAVSFSYFKN